MPEFSYEAKDMSGKMVSGALAAQTPEALGRTLRGRGLWLTRVATAPAAKVARKRQGGRVSSRDLEFLLSQLSLMLSAGTTVAEAFKALEDQVQSGAMRQALQNINQDLAQGNALSEALGRHPGMFDEVFVNLVRAGELSGNLGRVFKRLEDHYRKHAKSVREIWGALTYPLILGAVSLLALIVMVTVILPRFKEIFASSGARLPTITLTILNIGGFCNRYFYVLIPAVIGAVAGVVWWVRRTSLTAVVGQHGTRIPIARGFLDQFSQARLFQILGLMLEGGNNLLEVLGASRDVVLLNTYKEFLDEAVHRVTQGESLSAVFGSCPLFSPTVQQMVNTGEKHGKLAPVFNRLADYELEEGEAKLQRVSAIAGPAIILGLGVAVGVIAIALLLPLFRLSAAARGA